MMAITQTPSVLGIGFPMVEEVDPTGTLFDEEIERAKVQNIDLSYLVIDFVNEPKEKVLDVLSKKLKEQKYTVVSIGFGVRGNRGLTEVFEKMVNMCWELQPGVKLAFATSPRDVTDAAVRVLQ